MPIYERTRGVSLAQSAFECALTSAKMSEKVFLSKASNCFLPNFDIASIFNPSCP